MGGTLLWNVAQRFPTWGNVWKTRLSSHKDLALLSSIFGFRQLARKQHLNSLLYLVASAQLQLHTAQPKGRRGGQFVSSPLEFLFLSSVLVCIWLNLSESCLLVAGQERMICLHVLMCVFGSTGISSPVQTWCVVVNSSLHPKSSLLYWHSMELS